MEKTLTDLLKGSFRTVVGSFNSDLSAGSKHTREMKHDFRKNTGGGGGMEAFPTKKDGLHSPTLPGAEDDSLIKVYNK